MSEFKFDEVIITGGAGFIGLNLVEYLLPYTRKILVVDDFSNTNHNSSLEIYQNKKIVFYEKNIANQQELETIFKKNNVSVIFNLAALTSVSESFNEPKKYNEVNVTGFLNLIRLSLKYKVKKIVFASSASIYGNNTNIPLKEDSIPDPISPYAVTKVSQEYYSKIYNRLDNFEVVGLRYFNVQGPHQEIIGQDAGVIPLFIRNALYDKDLVIFGDGSQTRDFVYIDDVNQANVNAALISCGTNNIFNIGSGKQVAIDTLAKNIIEETNSKSKIVYKNFIIGEIKKSAADISNAKNSINYNPKINFEEGLCKTIEYYKGIF